MPYPDTDDKEIFDQQYFETVAAAHFPTISEIRNLVFEVLDKAKFPPNNPRLWPIYTFISKALDEKAPINWLTGPPFAEKIPVFRQILDFLEAGWDQGLVLIKKENGESVPCPPTPNSQVLESVAATMVKTRSFPKSEKKIEEALRLIQNIELTIGENQKLSLRIIPKPEAVEKNRNAVKEMLLEMDIQGELHFETMNGNPYGRPIETAPIMDTLVDLAIENLHDMRITDLSLVGHMHIFMDDQKIVGVKLCASDEGAKRLIRRMLKK